jgi:hypothetical protein
MRFFIPHLYQSDDDTAGLVILCKIAHSPRNYRSREPKSVKCRTTRAKEAAEKLVGGNRPLTAAVNRRATKIKSNADFLPSCESGATPQCHCGELRSLDSRGRLSPGEFSRWRRRRAVPVSQRKATLKEDSAT